MAGIKITSRLELVQWCLRRLGAPIIKINVTEEQCDDRLNEALGLFTEYHYAGSYRQPYVHKLTQKDIDNKYINLPDNIIAVLGVFLPSDMTSSSVGNVNNLQTVAYFSDMISSTYITGDFSNYVTTKSYMSTLQQMMPGAGSFNRISTFQVYSQKLKADVAWKHRKVGDLVGLDCYQFDDYDEVGLIYNDYWLKQYVTALIKFQWGTNLTKFSGISLPGGGQINGEQILAQAQEEIRDLEDKLHEKYSVPIEPFMG